MNTIFEPISCAICLEETTYVKCEKRIVKPKYSNPKTVQLKCGHVFHQKCIKKWYASKPPWESETKIGNDCPCCRQSIRFRGVSFMYNIAIMEYAYTPIEMESGSGADFDQWHEKTEIWYDEIRYIYFDNACICLFINDIKILMIHFCFFYLADILLVKLT